MYFLNPPYKSKHGSCEISFYLLLFTLEHKKSNTGNPD